MIDPHGDCWPEAHVPSPSTHQVSSLIAVNDWGANCAGSVAGAAAGRVSIFVVVPVLDPRAAAVLECEAVAAVGCGLPGCTFSSTIATTAATTAAAARNANISELRRGGRGPPACRRGGAGRRARMR